MNTTFLANEPRSEFASMNSLDTSGQMSVQCESMKVSTTVWPRKLASEIGLPDWSARVKPGAAASGTGDSCIKVASLVFTLAGMPVGRIGGVLLRAPSFVTANANTVAKTTPDTSATVASMIVERRDLALAGEDARAPGAGSELPEAAPACATAPARGTAPV